MKKTTYFTAHFMLFLLIVGSCGYSYAQTLVAGVVQWNRSGNHYVRGTASRICKLDAFSGDIEPLTNGRVDDTYPVLSHNKKFCLYMHGSSSLYMLNMKSHKRTCLYSGVSSGVPDDELLDYQWSFDDNYVAVLHTDDADTTAISSLIILSRAGKAITKINSAMYSMWANDSDRIYFVNRDYSLFIRRITGSKSRNIVNNCCPILTINPSKILVFVRSIVSKDISLSVLNLKSLQLSPIATIRDIAFRPWAYRISWARCTKDIYVICCRYQASDGLHGNSILINLKDKVHYDYFDKSDVDYQLAGAISNHQFVLVANHWKGGYKKAGFRNSVLILVDTRMQNKRKYLLSPKNFELDGASVFVVK